ncbi:TPA: hypothetical protein ACXLW6_004572 [Yersinia enterocolitica]
MEKLYCPECNSYLMAGDGECHYCQCGWKQSATAIADKKPIVATWSVSLDCTCPGCDCRVDLTDHADFWDDIGDLQVCEQDTRASTDLDVACPECGHEFQVNCAY